MLWIFRAGAAVSILYLVLLYFESLRCPHCLAVHFGNLGFWSVTEIRPRSTVKTLRPVAVLMIAFVVLSGLLGLLQWRRVAQENRIAEQQRSESVLRILSTSKTSEVNSTENGSPLVGRYRLGPEPAAIRLAVFTDYECEDCLKIHHEIRSLMASRKDLSLSTFHYPLCTDCNPHLLNNLHPQACRAARAAEAAGLVGGSEAFWKMDEWLFEQKGRFEKDQIRSALASMGIENASRFLATWEGPESLAPVSEDIEEAFQLGAEGTPMVFLNGVEFRGWQVEGALTRTVEEIASTHPPARSASGDQPIRAAEKFLNLWKKESAKTLADMNPVQSLGSPDNPIRVDLFTEYTFPYCRKANRVVVEAVSARQDTVLYLHLFPAGRGCNPLLVSWKKDPYAASCDQVRAVIAAGLLRGQEGFWKAHRVLESASPEIEGATLIESLAQVGLDGKRLAEEMESAQVESAIASTIDAASSNGVKWVPRLFVQGKLLKGWESPGVLEAVLDLAAEKSSGAKTQTEGPDQGSDAIPQRGGKP
jgi:protein-disulfide isomerase